MSTNQWIFFSGGTILVMIFTWVVSLKEKRYHGIPRFFVFEGLLLLGLLQYDIWFNNPLLPRQIVSWILLIASMYYAAYGIYIYLKITKPGSNFENTSKLVTTGLYKFIRHPMYASLLFLGWGMMLKDINPTTVNITGLLSIAVYLTCKVEEREMIARFGEDYKDYMKKTKLWIPFVI